MNLYNDDFMDIELDILNFSHQKLNLKEKIKKLNFILDKDKPFGILIYLLLHMLSFSLILFIPVVIGILFKYTYLIIPCLLIFLFIKLLKNIWSDFLAGQYFKNFVENIHWYMFGVWTGYGF